MTSLQHKTVRHMLQDLVDGDLSSTERQEVEDHLARCSVCREELDELTSTLGMLRALPRPEAPPDLEAKVRRRIRRRGAPDRRRHGIEHRIESTSAAAVLVAAIIVLGTRLVVPVPEGLDAAGTGTQAESSGDAHLLIQIRMTARDQAAARALWSLAARQGALDASGEPLQVPGSGDEIASGSYLLWLPVSMADAFRNEALLLFDQAPFQAVLKPILAKGLGQAARPPDYVGSETKLGKRKPRSDVSLEMTALLLVFLEEDAEAARRE